MPNTQTNALISEVAGINLFLFFFGLPGLIAFVNARVRISPEALNMNIIRWSLSILVIGSLLLALAPNSVLLVLCKLSIRYRTFGWEY